LQFNIRYMYDEGGRDVFLVFFWTVVVALMVLFMLVNIVLLCVHLFDNLKTHGVIETWY